MNFKESHLQESPILICNVWDVPSAVTAEKLNYHAIGTSSGAIASMLGYNDGEEMSFSELEYIVQRIIKNVSLPLTVDLEAGYSRDPQKIVDHIQRLSKLGVAGINIEDSLVDKKRTLVNAESFSELLLEVTRQLKNNQTDIFINVRTDTFLLGCKNPIEETIFRAKKYQAAGADGLFVPCIIQDADIESILKEINLPLNVMCMPDLSDFKTLKKLGVRRISMGNFVFNKITQHLEKELQIIHATNSFKSLFE